MNHTSKPPKVIISLDYSHGKRYYFKWRGYNKILFNALLEAGVTTEKVNGKWEIWCSENKFPSCMRTAAIEVLTFFCINAIVIP